MGFEEVDLNNTGAEVQGSEAAEAQSGKGAFFGRQERVACPRGRQSACPSARTINLVVCRTAARRLMALCFFFALSSCGKGLNPNNYPTPEALYEASMLAFENGDCGDAEIGFQRLSYDLPARDPRRAAVRYRLAECHFKRNRFLEAAREFRRVADEHAQDSVAPQALLRAGDSNSRLWRRPELDATYGLGALTVYSEVLSRFPASPAATEARERIGELNEQFASKAYKTGVYYFRLKAYDSAIIYFRTLVAEYPQTSFASEALLRLVDAYERIGYEEDKQDMCLQLQRYYPESVVHAPGCVSDTSST